VFTWLFVRVAENLKLLFEQRFYFQLHGMASDDAQNTPNEDEDFKFVAPAQKNLNEILEADKDDPSLQK
jgi:hypothetical protein